MRRLLVVAFLAVHAFWLPPAWACSCSGTLPPLAEVIDDAEVAFVGEVVEDIGSGDSDVRVDGVIKGDVRSYVILRKDYARGTSCASGPQPLGPIAYAGPAKLRTGPCGANQVSMDGVNGLALRPPSPGRDMRDGGIANALIFVLGLTGIRAARETRADRRKRRAESLQLQGLRLSR